MVTNCITVFTTREGPQGGVGAWGRQLPENQCDSVGGGAGGTPSRDEEQRGCVWTLPHGGPWLGSLRGIQIKQESSVWRFTSGSLPPSLSVDVFSTGGSRCHITDWSKPAHLGHLSLGAELPCTGLWNNRVRRGKGRKQVIGWEVKAGF